MTIIERDSIIYKTLPNGKIITKTHDYPNKIVYQKVSNDSLVAEIFGTKDGKIKSEVLKADEQKRFTLSKDWLNGMNLGMREKKLPEINFEGILKLTITKKGTIFTCTFNE